MDWRIYYEGGTVDSDGCAVENAPPRGVLAIVQRHSEVGWEVVSHADIYVWWRGRWQGVDALGYHDYLMQPGWKRVLIGVMVTREEFDRVFAEANEARAFGIKSGYLPREIRPDG